MHKVLIISNRNDSHANIVAQALRKKSSVPILWYPDEFILNQKLIQKISPNGEHIVKIKDNEMINLQEIDVVWYRRVMAIHLPQYINPLDQEFIEIENRISMKSLWLTIGESAKWINPFSSYDMSNSKVLQLREAARIGLNIPETLITNDRATIIAFIEKNEITGTLYKPFSSAIWDENDSIHSCYSSPITSQILPDDSSVSLTPGIYQTIIKKKFELRIVFFKDTYVAVKIDNSQALDWRTITSLKNLLTPSIIPIDIEQKCVQLMKKLNIIFGCFDFIITPENKYVFLEVNEMGQFLWIEEVLPELQILDLFCEFLLDNDNKKENYTSDQNKMVHSV